MHISILVVLEIFLGLPISVSADDLSNIVIFDPPVKLLADGESLVLQLVDGLLGFEGSVESMGVSDE